MKKHTILLLSIAGLLSLECSERKPEAPGFDVDSVIFITLDTARYDHFGFMGYPRNTTPHLDTMASEGIVFDRAFASMATTVPSHASMFTGLYPLSHTIRKNGHALPEDLPTLAESLRSQGFLTAGFVSTSYHFGAAGLSLGFDHFDEPPHGESSREYRNAEQTLSAARDWLESREAGQRFFLWIHLFDTHTPYDRSHMYEGGNSEDFAEFLRDEHHITRDYFASDIEMLDRIAAYDGELQFIDEHLGKFFIALETPDLRDSTGIIVASDHGEGLGTHNWGGHGKNVYNEQVKAILMLVLPDREFAGVRVDDVTELRSMPDIITEILGARSTLPSPGKSLTELLQQQNPASERQSVFAFSERREYGPESAIEGPPMHVNYEPGETFSLQNDRFKYIYRTEGSHEFFDLSADPYENHNLAGMGHPEETRFRDLIESKLRRLLAQRKKSRTVSADSIEGLKGLGYLQ